ncbi:MAG: tRNA (cytidine(34)-2'-O)-methyltransferase [Bacilli bacterium]
MLHIVLYEPEMPANVGNIMRTAVALNATLHIIGPTPFNFEDKNLKRAGLDYIGDLKLLLYASYDEFANKHKSKNIIYVSRYGKKNYTTFDYGRFDEAIYIMFGNESHGIPLNILKEHKENLVRIPMVANARSLNLGNAVAIVSYEVMRQQDFYGLASSEVIKGDDFLD